MSKLSRSEFKQLLTEWRSLVKESNDPLTVNSVSIDLAKMGKELFDSDSQIRKFGDKGEFAKQKETFKEKLKETLKSNENAELLSFIKDRENHSELLEALRELRRKERGHSEKESLSLVTSCLIDFSVDEYEGLS